MRRGRGRGRRRWGGGRKERGGEGRRRGRGRGRRRCRGRRRGRKRRRGRRRVDASAAGAALKARRRHALLFAPGWVPAHLVARRRVRGVAARVLRRPRAVDPHFGQGRRRGRKRQTHGEARLAGCRLPHRKGGGDGRGGKRGGDARVDGRPRRGAARLAQECPRRVARCGVRGDPVRGEVVGVHAPCPLPLQVHARVGGGGGRKVAVDERGVPLRRHRGEMCRAEEGARRDVSGEAEHLRKRRGAGGKEFKKMTRFFESLADTHALRSRTRRVCGHTELAYPTSSSCHKSLEPPHRPFGVLLGKKQRLALGRRERTATPLLFVLVEQFDVACGEAEDGV